MMGYTLMKLELTEIFLDEAHFFKNLETPTKMERVAGIQTGGSERAFDIFMKSRYFDEQHPGHGITFATGTPISNSLMEAFTMSIPRSRRTQKPWYRPFRRLGRNLRRSSRDHRSRAVMLTT